MLELSRNFAVDRPHSPTVFGVANALLGPTIDHRFNRETHTWMQSFLARLASRNVRNVGALVELLANAVPYIFVNDAVIEVLGNVVDDRLADGRNRATWIDGINSVMQAVKRTLHDRNRFIGNRFPAAD